MISYYVEPSYWSPRDPTHTGWLAPGWAQERKLEKKIFRVKFIKNISINKRFLVTNFSSMLLKT